MRVYAGVAQKYQTERLLLGSLWVKLLATELFFFLILVHTIYKMPIIQGPNTLEL